MARRPLIVALVVLSALVAGACVYVQTPAGFQGVVLPLANTFAPGEMEAESGRLGLSGSLRAEGLHYSATELGVEARVLELDLDLSIFSLLFGSLPHVNSLRLFGADIAISPAPSENDDAPAEKKERLVTRFRGVPISIEEAEVRNLNLNITHPSGAIFSVGPLELKIAGLLSGGTGRVEMSTRAKSEDPAEGANYSGNLQLDAQVQQDGHEIESLQATIHSQVRGAQDQQPTRFEMDLAASFDPGDEALTGTFDLRAIRGGQILGEVAANASAAVDDDGDETLSASLELREITELFLNPLIAPFGRGRVSAAQVEGRLDVSAGLPLDTSRLPHSARGELDIARFDYRALAIADARASLAANPDSLLVELAPSRINRGNISGKLSLDTGGPERVVDLELQAKALDLGALSKAFHEDVPNAVEGLLNLSASIGSMAPPGTDPRETANGRVNALLRNGRIKGFNLMAFLADQSGVEAFRAIPLDSFDVDAKANIADGVARLNEAEVSSAAVELLINGNVALMGSLDLTIEAFVGASLSGALSSVGVELPTLAAAERLIGIPVAIRVSGPLDAPSYGTAAPRTDERAADATKLGARAMKDAADKIKLQKAADKVKGFFR